MTTELNKFKYMIIKAFIEKYHTLYKTMNNVFHSEGISPYHLEGSVWTHTMMVMQNALTKEEVIVALLHDIGKPDSMTETVKNGEIYNYFTGHEAISFFTCKKIIDDICPDDEINEEGKRRIIIAIGVHGSFRRMTKEQISEKINGFDSKTQELILRTLEIDNAGRLSKDLNVLSLPLPSTRKNDSIYNNEIILMVGLPGCGKSTYIKRNLSNYYIISRDDLIEKYGVGENYRRKWNYIHSSKERLEEVDKILEKKINSAIKEKRNIVIDMTNLSKKGRRRILSKVRNKSYKKTAVLFSTSKEDSFKQAQQRKGKEISLSVYDMMIKKFTFPLFDEIDELIFI